MGHLGRPDGVGSGPDKKLREVLGIKSLQCTDFIKWRSPNIEKIRKLIRFEPKHDLEAMIQGVIDYFKE